MIEIWKPIIGYEGWYEVSSFGRVRSVDRLVKFRNGKGSRFYKGQILRQKYHNGYALVNLNKNKVLTSVYVHRLVAEAFLLKPIGKHHVNHIDGNKRHNEVTNLEWCTPAENNAHAIQNQLLIVNIDGLLRLAEKRKKPIAAYIGNEIVCSDKSAKDLAKTLMRNGMIVTNLKLDQVARQIKYAAKSGVMYYGFRFKAIS